MPTNQDTPFEKQMIRELRIVLNNRNFKSADLLEWSTSKDAVEKIYAKPK